MLKELRERRLRFLVGYPGKLGIEGKSQVAIRFVLQYPILSLRDKEWAGNMRTRHEWRPWAKVLGSGIEVRWPRNATRTEHGDKALPKTRRRRRRREGLPIAHIAEAISTEHEAMIKE